jgi:hypothetical protein
VTTAMFEVRSMLPSRMTSGRRLAVYHTARSDGAESVIARGDSSRSMHATVYERPGLPVQAKRRPVSGVGQTKSAVGSVSPPMTYSDCGSSSAVQRAVSLSGTMTTALVPDAMRVPNRVDSHVRRSPLKHEA